MSLESQRSGRRIAQASEGSIIDLLGQSLLLEDFSGSG
jgi:hypothetical protein